MGVQAQQLVFQFRDAMSGARRPMDRRDMTVAEARPIIEEAESERLENSDSVRPHLAFPV